VDGSVPAAQALDPTGTTVPAAVTVPGGESGPTDAPRPQAGHPGTPPAVARQTPLHGASTAKPRHSLLRLAAVMTAVALAAAGGWSWWRWHTRPVPAAPPTPPIPVVVAPAQQHDVPIYLVGIGTVQALNTVTIRARVDGQLDTVAFIEGQDLRKGDVLAQIDPRPFQAQLAQVQATRARDQATLANARLDLRRYATLASSQFATRQSVDTQTSLVAQLEAAVETDQAQIDYASVQLAYTTIRAPLSARTGVRLVDAGNIVHAADAGGLVVLTQVEPISVLFTLPEASFGAASRAHSAAQAAGGALAVQASDGSGAGPLGDGALLLINNQIDAATGTIQLKATFPNTDHALWPGQFVNVRLLVDTRRGAITVPAAAVQRGPGGTYAYVVKTDQTVEVRAVKVGQSVAGTVLIETGITGGDVVVTDGQLRLRAGTRVTTSPAGQLSPAASGAQP